MIGMDPVNDEVVDHAAVGVENRGVLTLPVAQAGHIIDGDALEEGRRCWPFDL